MLGRKNSSAAETALKSLCKKKHRVGFECDMERTFWMIMAPFVIMFLVFRVYPIVWGIILSFTNFTGFNLDTLKFLGLENYKHVFTDNEALPSIWKVFKIGIVTVPCGMVIAYISSIALSGTRRGTTAFRILWFLPAVIPGIAMTIMWRGMMAQDGGLLNTILELVGIKPINWFSNAHIKKGVMIMLIYGSTGGILTNIAAIKAIPNDLYEAADIEGANTFQKAITITLPMMSNMIYMGVLTNLIFTLQLFDQPVMLAGGATAGTSALTTVPPSSVYTYIVHVYQQIFVNMRFGYGLALVWVIFVIIMVLTGIVEWTKKYWVYKEVE